jgi:hypothetical protein
VSRFRQLSFPALFALAVLAGCGGDPKVAPGQRDVETIAAAVSDVVYQCGAVRAGYVARADGAAVTRDVDLLLSLHDRLDAGAKFDLPVAGAPTTLSAEMRLAARRLEGRCAPRQAARLRDALRD